MAKFKNIATGNILTVENKGTIALMEKSPNYVAVTAKGKADKPANKPEAGKDAE